MRVDTSSVYFLMFEDVFRIPPSKFDAILDHIADMYRSPPPAVVAQRYNLTNLELSSARGRNQRDCYDLFSRKFFFDFPIQRLVESIIIHRATREILTHESRPSTTTERNVFRAAKTRVLVLFAYTYVASHETFCSIADKAYNAKESVSFKTRFVFADDINIFAISP